MADENISITVEPYTGSAEVFNPDTAEPISFQLEPVTTPEVVTPPYVPEITPISPYTYPPSTWTPTFKPDEKPLVLNIECNGVDPFTNRIITIGFQDPSTPDENPTIIMLEKEDQMLDALFQYIKAGKYNQIVGYNVDFDFRFILIKAMYHGLACKEFYDCEMIDMFQATSQGKLAFVYNPQKGPTLSIVGGYFWGYPKDITDAEMIKAYAAGQTSVVLEFASGQITRTVLLYNLFRYITETPYFYASTGSMRKPVVQTGPLANLTPSKLTIPEARLVPQETYRCQNCLAELTAPVGTRLSTCPICGSGDLKVLQKR